MEEEASSSKGEVEREGSLMLDRFRLEGEKTSQDSPATETQKTARVGALRAQTFVGGTKGLGVSCR